MKLVGTCALIGTVLITCGLLTEATMARGQEAREPATQEEDAVLAAAKGQAALAEAREYMAAGRWRLARDAYATASTYLRGNAEAEDGYRRAQARLDEASGIDQLRQRIEIERQRARVEFSDAIRRASELLIQTDFAGARRVMITAQISVRQAHVNGYLGEPEFATLNMRAETLLDQISREEEQERLRRAQVTQAEAEKAKGRRQRDANQRRINLINQNLLRIRQLQMELKYDEALQVINEILFMDEHNPAALARWEGLLDAGHRPTAVAGSDVLARAPDVRSRYGFFEHVHAAGERAGAGGRSRERLVRLLERHDGVGALGDRGARHDAHRGAGLNCAVEDVAGGHLADHAQLARRCLGRARRVRRAHGVAVHRGVVERWDVEAGGDVLSQHLA